MYFNTSSFEPVNIWYEIIIMNTEGSHMVLDPQQIQGYVPVVEFIIYILLMDKSVVIL